MNKRRWILLGGVLTTLLAAAAIGAQAAYADTTTPPAPPDERGTPPEGAPRHHPLGPAGLEAAAGLFGMTADDLSTALRDGTTLDELATEKGIDIEAVRAAVQAAHKETMLGSINQAVADGKMTQDKADWLILGLENGYLDGPGFGPGMGFGGPRGGPGPRPQATQSAGD
jgi:hypothetical protein